MKLYHVNLFSFFKRRNSLVNLNVLVLWNKKVLCLIYKLFLVPYKHLYKINWAIHFSAGFLTSKIVFKFLGFFSWGIDLSSALVEFKSRMFIFNGGFLCVQFEALHADLS